MCCRPQLEHDVNRFEIRATVRRHCPQSLALLRDSPLRLSLPMTTLSVEPLETAFNRAWPQRDWRESHAVFAVSGGGDSVAMLRAAFAIKNRGGGRGQLFAAHLDHGLRGAASAGDAEWLKILCGRLKIPLEIGKADVAAIADLQGDGLEAAARTARYEFLQRTAEKLGARFVAVAHTADDQIETVLHRILRGTGIDGLRGIPTIRPLSPAVTLVRPLLAVRRRDVLDYLTSIGQDFRTDASNADFRMTRNRLRYELLPAIRSHYPGDFDAALLRLSARAADAQQVITAIVDELKNGSVTFEGEPAQAASQRSIRRIRVACGQLVGQPPLILREVCKAAWQDSGWPRQAMGYEQWHLLASLVAGSNVSFPINLPGKVRAWRDGGDVILERSGLP
jgi:tRNA(Ile)-lysidine synthase